jgi:DNA-binding PadR family transcriptional regulator
MPNTRDDRFVIDLNAYAGPTTLILMSLAEGAKHGYALATDIEDVTGVKLSPATLYGALERLQRRGLIVPFAAERRRQPFGLTPHGADLLYRQLRAQRHVTKVGLRRLARHWSLD